MFVILLLFVASLTYVDKAVHCLQSANIKSFQKHFKCDQLVDQLNGEVGGNTALFARYLKNKN